MIKRKRFRLPSLPIWLVLSIVMLVILTAGTTGLPAIILVSRQLDRQLWQSLEQGSRITNALIAAQRAEFANLALLTAQRPTLRTLIESGDKEEMLSYLNTLRRGADIDMLILCDTESKPVHWVGREWVIEHCRAPESGILRTVFEGEDPTAWLLSTQPIEHEHGRVGFILLGRELDQDYIENLHRVTGFEHSLLFDGTPGATSLDSSSISTQVAPAGAQQVDDNLQSERLVITTENQSYYAIRFLLGDSDVEDLIALSISEISTTKKQLNQTILASMILISIVGSGVGIFLAQRIANPLIQLKDAALALRKGDLSSQINVSTRLPEVETVASALEEARKALRFSLSELRQEKEWIETLLESIVEGILTLDRQLQITYFSNGAEKITGLKQEQVLGLHCDQVFKLAGEELFSQRIPPAGKRQTIEVILQDGRSATLTITGSRIAPPQAAKSPVALVLHDVSEEYALHHLLANFLANITHEFRTPLSALAASVELLLEQLPDLNQDELGELLNSLHLGVINLQTLVDNLLEGASIEAGRFRVYPQVVDLREIIDESIRIMQPLLVKYEHLVSVEAPDELPQVLIDPKRTLQVLINLFSNVVKYTPAETDIQVSVSHADPFMKVSVADRGPGVSQELQQSLIYPTGDLSTTAGSAIPKPGLGLTVVRAIIEAQGGLVGVHERSGGGAVFWFTLPAASPMERIQ